MTDGRPGLSAGLRQVYEAPEPGSLAEVRALFDWSRLRVYDLSPAGGNHGILLGTRGWRPPGEPTP